MTVPTDKHGAVVIKGRPDTAATVTTKAKATPPRNNPRSPWGHGPMCKTNAAWTSYRAYQNNAPAKRKTNP